MEARMSRTRTTGPTGTVGHVGHFAAPMATADPAEGDENSGAYDALTDLFLGDPIDQAPPSTPSAPNPRQVAPHDPEPLPFPSPLNPPADTSAEPVRFEGLILGHLPVLASAWVHQYARHTAAQHHAPVALLKLRGGECSLELIGVDHPGEVRPAVQLAPTLDIAAELAADRARIWLIRVDDIAEPHLAEMDALDTITLLTGAHEAAVVASYRTIKQLFKPAGEDREDGPEVGLAIMGAGEDRAADARHKLERAAETFLGRQVDVSACVAKIGPGRSTMLFRGPLTLDAISILERLIPTVRAHKVELAASLHADAPAAATAAAATPQRDQAAPVSRLGHASTTPDQVLHPAQPVPVGPGPGALASHIPGLAPIEAVCPYAPQVQLATDHAGMLHLLALGGTHAADAVTTRVAHLLTAAAWAKAHWDLLRLSIRSSPAQLGPTAEPHLHLLTADARTVRSLGDAPVRLHLLAPVQAGSTTVWFCTELN